MKPFSSAFVSRTYSLAYRLILAAAFVSTMLGASSAGAQDPNLSGINARLLQFATTVNSKTSTTLSASDLAPYFDANFKHEGQGVNYWAAMIAGFLNGGSVSGGGASSILSLGTDGSGNPVAQTAGSVVINSPQTGGQPITAAWDNVNRDGPPFSYWRQVSGVWNLYGDQAPGYFAVRTIMGNWICGSGNICTNPVAQEVKFEADTPQGTVTSVAVQGIGLMTRNSTGGTSPNDSWSLGPYPPVLTFFPTTGTPYTFNVVFAAGGSQQVVRQVPKWTNETISMSASGHALANANLGGTLNISWTLPISFAAQKVNISVTTASANGMCNTDITPDGLPPSTTSYSFTMPQATCNGAPIADYAAPHPPVSVEVHVKGVNGEETAVRWWFGYMANQGGTTTSTTSTSSSTSTTTPSTTSTTVPTTTTTTNNGSTTTTTSSSTTTTTPPASTSSWETKATMPTARWGAASGVIDGKLYVAGGQTATGSLATLEVYDPASNTWTTKAPMPTARYGTGGAVINGKLYVVGGDIAASQKLATLEVYDPATDTWTTKAPMPTARSGPGVVAIGGQLYVAGGCRGWCAPATAVLEVYDPATDTWTTKATMPTARGGASVEVVGGLFYVMGGCCGSITSDSELKAKTIEVYNPTTNAWASKIQHAAGTNGTAGSIDGKIYVTGFGTAEVYDPAADSWAYISAMATARYLATGGVINGTFYVAGGTTGNGVALATLESLTPVSIAPYTADGNTVLLDHFDGATSASILAYNENGAACGAAKPSATPNSAYSPGPHGLNLALTLLPPIGQPVGSGTYLQYPGGQLLSQPNGSIEFWTYLTTYGASGVSLVQQGPFPGSCAGWTYSLAVNSGGQLRSAAWAAFDVTSGAATVPLNAWTHVAATWGSTGAKLYINGAQVGSDTNTGMPASGYSGSVLVNYGAGGIGTQIDELRISNLQRTSFGDIVTGATTTTTTTTSSSTSTTTTSSTTTTTLGGTSGTGTLNLVAGWNLVGNSSSGALDVAATFGDANKVTTVWKWIASLTKWAFYTPTQGDGGATYASGKGYDFLTSVAGGEGFWVNAKNSFTAQLPSGSPVNSASFQTMESGWNLIAIGDEKTPKGFNSSLSLTPPSAGDIPINLTSLWAWDATQGNWYFYAPNLDKAGTLSTYIQSKNYLDFGTKTLGSTMGFWVNKP